MQEKTLIRIVASLTTVVWIGVVLERGAKFDISLLTSFGGVVTIVVFLTALFDRFLWRLPVVNMAFRRHRPIVRGTWTWQAKSNGWDTPFDGFLVINQTFSRVSVKTLMETGWSETLASSWGKSDDGNPAIFYVWRRFPRQPEDDADLDDTPGFIHHGAGVLEICGNAPYVIKGPYWTCERYSGQVLSELRHRKVSRSFKEAAALFDGLRPS